jgi:hypothetical protein
MPWKNPHCPVCHGKTKKIAVSINPDKWIYQCNSRKGEQHIFETWGHRSEKYLEFPFIERNRKRKI